MANGIFIILSLGLITLISMLFTASISIMNKRGINKIPFKWHPRFAFLTIALALIHGILAFLYFSGFITI